MPHDHDPRASLIAARLDRAHLELPTPELAQLLIALEPPASRLAAAEAPFAGDSAVVPARLVPALLRIQRDLTDVSPDRARRVSLGRWLRGYIDEVAARPRGAAIPIALAG